MIFCCLEAALKSFKQFVSTENKYQANQCVFVQHVKPGVILRALQKYNEKQLSVLGKLEHALLHGKGQKGL